MTINRLGTRPPGVLGSPLYAWNTGRKRRETVPAPATGVIRIVFVGRPGPNSGRGHEPSTD